MISHAIAVGLRAGWSRRARSMFGHAFDFMQTPPDPNAKLRRVIERVRAIPCTDLRCRNAMPTGHKLCIRCEALMELEELLNERVV